MMFDPVNLRQIAEWRQSLEDDTLGVADFVGERVGPAAAVAVAGLLWPLLIRVEGHVLIADRYDVATFAAWRARGLNRAAVEAAINHVHLWDVFADADEVSTEALGFLGQVMAKTWQAAAADAFPEDDLVVEYSNGSDDYGPTVTLRSRE